MHRIRVLLLVAFGSVFSLAAVASPTPLNPCLRSTARCVAGDRFLTVEHRVDLANPGRSPADVRLLPAPVILVNVEGRKGDLVVNRRADGIWASVPEDWSGTLTLRVRQPIAPATESAASRAVVPLPPALIRSATVEVPGRNVELTVGGPAVVRSEPSGPESSRFRVVPIGGECMALCWRQRPPQRPARFSIRQTHRITQRGDAFSDAVTLTLTVSDASLEAVSVRLPDGVYIDDLSGGPDSDWSLSDGTLTARPHGQGGALSATLMLEGATPLLPGGGRELAVPLLTAEGADRYEGKVLVAAAEGDLRFAELRGATQAAVEGGEKDRWRLACNLNSPAARVVVLVAPKAPRREARVLSDYRLSPYRARGRHVLTVTGLETGADRLGLTVPAGDIVQRVEGDRVLNWVQAEGRVNIDLKPEGTGALVLSMQTEHLTGGEAVALAPPAVQNGTPAEWSVRLTAEPGTLLQPDEATEPWRVQPETVSADGSGAPADVAYRFPQAPERLRVRVVPAAAQVRGNIQDHLTVSSERLLRETLFLLEIERQQVSELVVALPEGLVLERVDGPWIEEWSPVEPGRVVVRFREPVLGSIHFRTVCSRAAAPVNTRIGALGIESAPDLQGWIGISSELDVAARPSDGGALNLGAVPVSDAPTYLQGFENTFLYRFYDSRWRLGLDVRSVPPVYTAEVLQVLSFSASGVQASAQFLIDVQQGGLDELMFRMPEGAAGSQFQGDAVVAARLEDGEWRVRLEGLTGGKIGCRLDYAVPTGSGEGAATVAPVRLVGARSQSGVLLLTQSRPDVEVVPGLPGTGLSRTDPREQYARWDFARSEPALAAYSFQGTGWALPLTVSTPALSDTLLKASIPLAKLATVVRPGRECLHHLRLYVSNTNRQFLTADLGPLGEGARLIGTYVYGEPVKPFREGSARIQLPLFTSEKAARYGMAVVDITYAEPSAGLKALRRNGLRLPDLGLNVGRFEWSIGVPDEYRLAGVGGNMDEPVSDAPAPESLGSRLVHPVLHWFRQHAGTLISLAIIAAVVWGCVWAVRTFAALRKAVRSYFLHALVLVFITLVLVAMLMPALSKARSRARVSMQSSNLHQIGLGISMYRNDHDGQYPPGLEALVEGGYLEDVDVLDTTYEEQDLVYRPRSRNAHPAEVLAYAWPPVNDGVNVLYVDGAVEWVPVAPGEPLLNQRLDDRFVRAGETLTLATRPSGGISFGKGYGLDVAELEEALDVQQREYAGRAGGEAARQRAEEVVQAATADVNREKLESALERYRAEHGGTEPEMATDLYQYTDDPQLREALVDADMMPALNKARQSSRLSSQRHNLHNIGLAISIYRMEHNGAYPPDLAALVKESHIEDTEILDPVVEGHRFVYRRLSANARPAEVVAYAWPPRDDKVNVLYVDGAVEAVSAAPGRPFRNPRDPADVVQTPGARSDEAAQVADRTETTSPDDAAKLRYNLGQEFLNRGDYEQAEANLRRALELKPEYAQAERQLAQVEALKKATSRGRTPLATKDAPEEIDLKRLQAKLDERERLAPRGGQPQQTAGLPRAAPAPEEPTSALAALVESRPARPLSKASLVQRAGGGRSVGARPILIDFPPLPTANYRFTKSFLGRGHAEVTFRAIGTRMVGLLELALAAVALAVYALLRSRSATAGVNFAGATLLLAIGAHFAGSGMVASAAASTIVAMFACLAVEIIVYATRRLLSLAHRRRRRTT